MLLLVIHLPELPIAPFKRMVRKIDSNMKIADNAKREIRNVTERFAMEVLRGATEIAKVAKRRTILKEDIRIAKRQLIKTV